MPAILPFRRPAATTPSPTPTADRILRLPAVQARVGLSRASIYRAVAREAFPRPVPLGGRAIGWHESAINQWIAQRGQGGAA
jgi:prophage regulatory protein